MCTARGRPAPEIAWFYKTFSRSRPEAGALDPEQSLVDSPKVISIDLLENMTEESGRTLVTSRLILSTSENDGGVIRCKAGSAYKDSRLTVLSKSISTPIITILFCGRKLKLAIPLYGLYFAKMVTISSM